MLVLKSIFRLFVLSFYGACFGISIHPLTVYANCSCTYTLRSIYIYIYMFSMDDWYWVEAEILTDSRYFPGLPYELEALLMP